MSYMQSSNFPSWGVWGREREHLLQCNYPWEEVITLFIPQCGHSGGTQVCGSGDKAGWGREILDSDGRKELCVKWDAQYKLGKKPLRHCMKTCFGLHKYFMPPFFSLEEGHLYGFPLGKSCNIHTLYF